jgi:hypothetical protein
MTQRSRSVNGLVSMVCSFLDVVATAASFRCDRTREGRERSGGQASVGGTAGEPTRSLTARTAGAATEKDVKRAKE